MKQKYEMTEAEYQGLIAISKNQEPVIFVGVWLGLDTQKKANKLWQLLADKYGFVWDTVEPCGDNLRIFLATPRGEL